MQRLFLTVIILLIVQNFINDIFLIFTENRNLERCICFSNPVAASVCLSVRHSIDLSDVCHIMNFIKTLKTFRAI